MNGRYVSEWPCFDFHASRTVLRTWSTRIEVDFDGLQHVRARGLRADHVLGRELANARERQRLGAGRRPAPRPGRGAGAARGGRRGRRQRGDGRRGGGCRRVLLPLNELDARCGA